MTFFVVNKVKSLASIKILFLQLQSLMPLSDSEMNPFTYLLLL